jgi:hypothetical protein
MPRGFLVASAGPAPPPTQAVGVAPLKQGAGDAHIWAVGEAARDCGCALFVATEAFTRRTCARGATRVAKGDAALRRTGRGLRQPAAAGTAAAVTGCRVAIGDVVTRGRTVRGSG